MAERERETGGWAQFDWLLGGGSFKARPIEFWQFSFNKNPTDVSPQKYISCCYILCQEKYLTKKSTKHKWYSTILNTVSFQWVKFVSSKIYFLF
jgi:hypothetical protein